MKFKDASCSEERMDRARRGILPAPEMIDFATHLTLCPDCRMAWRIFADFQGSAGAVPGDELIVERATRAALASGRGRTRRWVSAIPAAAAVLVAAGVASGAIALRARYLHPHDSATAVPASPRRSGRPVPGAIRSNTSTPVPSPTLVAPPEPPRSPPALSTVEGGVPRRAPLAAARSLQARPTKIPPVSRQISLASPAPTLDLPAQPAGGTGRCAQGQEALARAVHQRNEGDSDAAVQSFLDLQTACTGLPEAMVSLVSMGELLLGRGDASQALASFDAYLRGAPSGTLAPEALEGKARALVQLGRGDEAQAIWREVTRRFPRSPYARHVAAGTRGEGTAP